MSSNSSNIEIEMIENMIEKKIETKLNNFFSIYNTNKIVKPKTNGDITIYELYTETLQTSLDIIDDITKLTTEDYNYSNIYDILLREDRKLYVGIILIIISFILYFIDGVDT